MCTPRDVHHFQCSNVLRYLLAWSWTWKREVVNFTTECVDFHKIPDFNLVPFLPYSYVQILTFSSSFALENSENPGHSWVSFVWMGKGKGEETWGSRTGCATWLQVLISAKSRQNKETTQSLTHITPGNGNRSAGVGGRLFDTEYSVCCVEGNKPTPLCPTRWGKGWGENPSLHFYIEFALLSGALPVST